MKRLVTIILIAFYVNSFAGIINVGDTTLTSNWNAGGNILNISGKISGAYTLSNAIIQANPFMQIFDTTVTLGANIQCDKFSCMWYGAKPSNTDNSTQLQLAINACINNAYPLIFPNGQFKTSKTLWASIYDSVNNRYVQTQIAIKGTAHYWGDNGSRILYSGNGNAINFQLNKGSEVSGLIITGGWVSPGGSTISYFNLPDSMYVNQAATGNGTGLAIDPTSASGQTSGSTGCYFHDMQISGFRTLIGISNNSIQNGECMVFERIQFGSAYYGVRTSQPQEKYNVFRDIYSWASINYIFTISRGAYWIDGMNVAGLCRNLFNIYSSGYFASYIRGVYAENIGSVGIIYSGLAMSVSDCQFDFAYRSYAGTQTLLNANANNIQFNSCNFRYYGSSDTLTMIRSPTFNNCYFSGTVTGLTTPVFMKYNGGNLNVTQTFTKDTVIINNVIRQNFIEMKLHPSYLSE